MARTKQTSRQNKAYSATVKVKKRDQKYSPKLIEVLKIDTGTKQMLHERIYKYVKENNLVCKNVNDSSHITADSTLKELFGKETIDLNQDMDILTSKGHIKPFDPKAAKHLGIHLISKKTKQPAYARIKRDLEEIQRNAPEQCSAGLVDNNMYHWEASIMGPPQTPYEDGAFFLTIKFPKEFPIKPPVITFKTRIYHPNINSMGVIGLDILAGQWSPVLTISKVLLAISSLLSQPSLDNAMDPKIADQYKGEKDKYNEIALDWTKKYAM